jgi:hypothetical protein
VVSDHCFHHGRLNWIGHVRRKANCLGTLEAWHPSCEPLEVNHSRGIVDLTDFAHLSGISGLRQVTGFRGLHVCGNALKQPTSAQVDDAVCEAPLMLSQQPNLILPVIRSSRRLRNGSPLAGLSLKAPIPAPE